MQISIIPPSQFKTIPWKNGKGQTVELAINDGATLDNFSWRISMADVVENGEFSDFSDYLRNLVLIKGKAITLKHSNNQVDELVNPLDVATFDGGNKTMGLLPAGPITDFNIITQANLFDVHVFTSEDFAEHRLAKFDLAFVYGLTADIQVKTNSSKEAFTLPARHLAKLEQSNNKSTVTASGREMIVVSLKAK